MAYLKEEDGNDLTIAITAMCHAVATMIRFVQPMTPHRDLLEEVIQTIRDNLAMNGPH